MKYIVWNIVIVLIILLVPIRQWYKERGRRRKAEEMLGVVKKIGEIDDRIFRMRIDDPEDWPGSPEATMLISKRIQLYEKYSVFLGYHQPNQVGLMNALMRASLAKQRK